MTTNKPPRGFAANQGRLDAKKLATARSFSDAADKLAAYIKIILGLAGEMASGNGTVAEYIVKKYGGATFRLSTILRDILRRLQLEGSRENLQKLSTVLRENFGQDILSLAIFNEVKNSSNKNNCD